MVLHVHRAAREYDRSVGSARVEQELEHDMLYTAQNQLIHTSHLGTAMMLPQPIV